VPLRNSEVWMLRLLEQGCWPKGLGPLRERMERRGILERCEGSPAVRITDKGRAELKAHYDKVLGKGAS